MMVFVPYLEYRTNALYIFNNNKMLANHGSDVAWMVELLYSKQEALGSIPGIMHDSVCILSFITTIET